MSRFAPTSPASRSNLAPSAPNLHLSRKSWSPAHFAPPAQILRVPNKLCAFSQILCFTPKYCALPPNLAPCAQFLRLLDQFLRLAPKFELRAQISAQILRLASKSRTLCPIFAPPSPNLSPRAQICASMPKYRAMRPNVAPLAQTSCLPACFNLALHSQILRLATNTAPCGQFLRQILCLAPKFVRRAQLLRLVPKCCASRLNLLAKSCASRSSSIFILLRCVHLPGILP